MSAKPFADAALKYAAHGWCVFPLAVRGKVPRIGENEGGQGFKNGTTDPAQLSEWLAQEPCANIGLWPGASGLCVLDVDGPNGEAAARELGLFDVATLTCLTGRPDGGRHLYFARPNFTVSNARAGIIPNGIDVRCDGGYVVLPPSVHPSGTVYRWQGRASDIRPLPARACEVLRQAQEPDEPRVVPYLGTFTPPTPDELDRRVRAYLARVGAAAEGQRNVTAFLVSAWLLNDMALTEVEAWGYVVEWNAGNAPPLRTRELLNTFKSALKHGRRPKGCGLAQRQARGFTHARRTQTQPFAHATSARGFGESA